MSSSYLLEYGMGLLITPFYSGDASLNLDQIATTVYFVNTPIPAVMQRSSVVWLLRIREYLQESATRLWSVLLSAFTTTAFLLAVRHSLPLLLLAIWFEGKGNIGYGANIGSNHTGRLPDQESIPGEGVFFGLGCSIKYPCNLRNAPYSIIASGVVTLPEVEVIHREWIVACWHAFLSDQPTIPTTQFHLPSIEYIHILTLPFIVYNFLHSTKFSQDGYSTVTTTWLCEMKKSLWHETKANAISSRMQ